MEKRYYWLRLHDDFFSSARIKKLRRMAGGDTYLIIYLKMQLKAMKNDGIIRWTGLEENIADELALDLDEKVEDVQMCLAYLLSCGLAETDDSISYFFPFAVANVGSEGSSAQRVREFRERKSLQCNADVTPMKQICNGEKEIEKEIEIDTREEKSKRGTGRSKFSPPTLEEVAAYCSERKNGVDPQRFIDHYTSNGWMVGKNKMRDWRAAVRTWEQREPSKKGKFSKCMTEAKPMDAEAEARWEENQKWMLEQYGL